MRVEYRNYGVTKGDFMIDEKTTKKQMVHYSVKTKTGWGVPMTGLTADDDSIIDHAGIIGESIINFKIEGTRVKKARVKTVRGKWLDYGIGFDTELGNDSDIAGIEIVGEKLMVSVHVKGGQWINPVYTSTEEGAVLINSGSAIDAIWIDEV